MPTTARFRRSSVAAAGSAEPPASSRCAAPTILSWSAHTIARFRSTRIRMADDQLNLSFSGRARSPLIRRLTAIAAPIAIDAGSIVDDEELLDVARAVCAAFSHDDAVGGLTKAEIAARVKGTCDPATLESRLGVFLRSEMLRPVHDKKHQQRYVLAPAGLVGILIFDRVSERGGVEELLGLLDRAKSALERHEADAPAVAAALESCRAMFAVFANELNRLVTGARCPSCSPSGASTTTAVSSSVSRSFSVW